MGTVKRPSTFTISISTIRKKLPLWRNESHPSEQTLDQLVPCKIGCTEFIIRLNPSESVGGMFAFVGMFIPVRGELVSLQSFLIFGRGGPRIFCSFSMFGLNCLLNLYGFLSRTT